MTSPDLPPDALKKLKALERLRSRYINMQDDRYLPPHMRDFNRPHGRAAKQMLHEVNELARWLRERMNGTRLPEAHEDERQGEESPYRAVG